MSVPGAAMDKFARLWGELEEANPECLGSHFAAEAGASRSGLATLQHELKRLKFVFTDVEAQRRFADVAQSQALAQEPPAPTGEMGGAASMELSRKEAKDKNKALKTRIEREQQLQAQLLKDLTEASRRATALHETCAHDLREAELGGAGVPVDLDLQLGASGTAESLEHCADESGRFSEDAQQLWAAKGDAAVKRRRLEADLRRLEAQKRQHQARTGAFARELEREGQMIQSLLQLQEAEAQLGLPRLEIDHERGVALLGEPPGTDEVEAEALRTIQIQFDEDGTLRKAEPHPALGLQRFAAKAVECQDFGMLPTLAWGRLCDAAADPGPEDLDGRVRRLSGAGA